MKKVGLLSGLILTVILTGLLFVACEVSGGPDEGPNNNSSGRTAAPRFSQAAGVYKEPISLTLSAEDGAEITYTIYDGSDNILVDSKLYAGESIDLKLNSFYKIEAFARKSGFEQSETVTALYEMTGKVATPQILDVANGKFNTRGERLIKITCATTGATIKFTENSIDLIESKRVDPHEGLGFLFNPENPDLPENAIKITETLYLHAFAYKEGWDNSDIIRVKIGLKISNPNFYVDQEAVNHDNHVAPYGSMLKFADYPGGVNVLYAADPFGTATPTTIEGTVTGVIKPYSGSNIQLLKPDIYSVRASMDGWEPSDQVTKKISLKLPPVNFDPDPTKSYFSKQPVKLTYNETLLKEYPGIKIFYQMGPNKDSLGPETPYDMNNPPPVEVDSTTAFNAYARMTGGPALGWVDSADNRIVYQFNLQKPEVFPKPALEPFEIKQKLEFIYDNTNSTKVYYTINDATDRSNDPVKSTQMIEYKGAFFINGDLADYNNNSAEQLKHMADSSGRARLRFVAHGDGGTSEITEYTYIFQLPSPSGAPEIKGDISQVLTFKLSAENGASIEYDMSGKDLASVSGDSYQLNTDLEIKENTKFRAIARKSNWMDSKMLVRDYSFTPALATLADSNGVPVTNEQIFYDEQSLKYFSPTKDAIIYYTDDESDPKDPAVVPRTFDSQTLPIRLKESKTFRFFTWHSTRKWNRSASSTIRLLLKAKTPTMTLKDPEGNPISYPQDGIVKKGSRVYMDIDYQDKNGFIIIYTTDGSDPTKVAENRRQTLSPGNPDSFINVDSNMTIKAYAIKTGWERSDILNTDNQLFVKINQPEFVIKNKAVYTPVQEPNGEFKDFVFVLNDEPAAGSPIEVLIQKSSQGATSSTTIKYTDQAGAEPDRLYFSGQTLLNVTKPNSLFRAYEYYSSNANTYVPSDIAEAYFRFKVQQPAIENPNSSPATSGPNAPDRILLDKTVTSLNLSCSTVKATVKYTVTEPGNPGIIYAQGECLYGDYIIKDLTTDISPVEVTVSGLRTDWLESESYSQIYERQVETPYFGELYKAGATPADDVELPAGTVEDVDKVTLYCDTAGAEIHYTLTMGEGAEQTVVTGKGMSGTVIEIPYNSPVVINLKAIKTGWVDSTSPADLTLKRCLKAPLMSPLPEELQLTDGTVDLTITTDPATAGITLTVNGASASAEAGATAGEWLLKKVDNSRDITLVATKSGWLDSPELAANYIKLEKPSVEVRDVALPLDTAIFKSNDVDAIIHYEIDYMNGQQIERGQCKPGSAEATVKLLTLTPFTITAHTQQAGRLRSSTYRSQEYNREIRVPEFDIVNNRDNNFATIGFKPHPDGAKIYFTTDNTIPDEAPNMLYDGVAFNVENKMTIKAIAINMWGQKSQVVTLNVEKCTAPVLSDNTQPLMYGVKGSGIMEIPQVKVDASPLEQEVRFQRTDDGQWLTGWETLAAGGNIEIRRKTTIKARRVMKIDAALQADTIYISSDPVEQQYTVKLHPARFITSNAATLQIPNNRVELRAIDITVDAGVKIVYNTVSTNDIFDKTYNGPIVVKGQTTIYAQVTKEGCFPSDVVEKSYKVGLPKPVIGWDLSDTGHNTQTSANVTITFDSTIFNALDEPEIYYNLGQSGNPDPVGMTNGTKKFAANSSILINSQSTFKAVLVCKGWENSGMATRTFRKAPTPTMNNSGATYGYTVNGSRVPISVASGSNRYYRVSTNNGTSYSGWTNGNSGALLRQNSRFLLKSTYPGRLSTESTTNYVYYVRLNSPGFTTGTTIYKGTAVIFSLPGSTPAGSKIFYSSNGGTSYSEAVNNRAVVNDNSKLYIRTQCAGYVASGAVNRTYTIKLNSPSYVDLSLIGTGGGGNGSVTGRRLRFRLPAGSPAGSVIQFSTNGTNYQDAHTTSGEDFTYNVGLGAVTVYAIVVKSGYVPSNSLSRSIPAHQ